MLPSSGISQAACEVGEDAVTHTGKATPATPARAGVKPPPGRPPADGAKKGAPHSGPHAPAPHGAPPHGPPPHGKPPHQAMIPPPRAGGRRPIDDDDAETPPVAKPAAWSLKMPSLNAVKRAAMVALTLLTTGAAAYGSVWEIRHYMDIARHTRVQAAIAVALEAHTHRHQGEGRSFEEISFTDYLRRCLGASLSSPDRALELRLDGVSGPDLLTETEGACLRSKIADILLMPKKGEISEAEEMSWKETQIRAFLVFASEHGYQFPPDLMTYEHSPEMAQLRPKAW